MLPVPKYILHFRPIGERFYFTWFYMEMAQPGESSLELPMWIPGVNGFLSRLSNPWDKPSTQFKNSQIGGGMIESFGSYHVIFWDCQMFAKCHLHIITGNDTVFTQWISPDVSNLFLCTVVLPMPLRLKQWQLEDEETQWYRNWSSEGEIIA